MSSSAIHIMLHETLLQPVPASTSNPMSDIYGRSKRDPNSIDRNPDPLACNLTMLYCDLTLCLSTGSGLAADISLGAVNGAAAVQYVRNMVQAAPPLKTLVLFVKSLLKVRIHAGLDCCDRMSCNLHHAVQDIDAGQVS